MARAIQIADETGEIHIRFKDGACLSRSLEDERAEGGESGSILGAQDPTGQLGLTGIGIVRTEDHEAAFYLDAGAHRWTVHAIGVILALRVVRNAQRARLASEFDRMVASRIKCVSIEDKSRFRHHEDIGAGVIADATAVLAAAAHGIIIFKKRIALKGHGAAFANEDRAAASRSTPSAKGNEFAIGITRGANIIASASAANAAAEPLIAASAANTLFGARSAITT